MAKMFYSIEETSEKLGKSEDEIKEMVENGQLQEFRDRDKLMFKVDQIDLLSATEDETSEIHLGLEDTSGVSGSGLDLADESVIGLADSREATGISVFDTDHSGEGDDIAGDTQVGGTQVGVEAVEDELSLEAIGSGSGLLDLTRESDDTSLGAELLEEVYSGDTASDIAANASGLFEAAGADTADEAVPVEGGVAAMASMPMIAEVYDGSGSGLGVGMMIGSLIALVCVAIIIIVSIMGSTPMLTGLIADKLWIWVGGIFGATVVFGLIGLFIGKASE
ncbi:MAG: hypothetical protein O7G85_03795 [Planctomycetota bacterium]|nr:hypothetical protein [Planctomycetota bacterium]